MAKPGPTTVDDYIALQPEAVRDLLEKVRTAIRRGIPGAAESISYNIPTYKLDNKPVIYFAAWKHHYSVYPVTDNLRAEFKDDLSAYEVEKGTIRFPLSTPAPSKLIERLARFRANEVTASRSARKKASQ
jgi:uncharacterized protein YdhG (YjbR/CyaY superfamily)